MPELTDLSVIRALCEKYDFALSKGFGQNFIINPGIPTKIVDASGVDKRYGVIEIGPGIGVLTKELAKRAAKVVSIEVDERLPPLLAETMAGVDNFKLVLQDVLKVDLKALIAEEFPGMAAGGGLDGDFVGGTVNGDIVLLDHVCSLLKIKLDFFNVDDVHAAGRDTDLFRESGSDRGHDLRLHALRLGRRRGGGSRSGGSGGRCFLFALEDRTHCHGEENDADQAKEHRANTHQGNKQAAVFHFFLLPFNLDYSKAIAQFASAYALFARF